MDFPKIGTPLGSLIISGLLWIWTIHKGKAHIFQQEVILRDRNKAASLSFLICILLGAVTIYWNISPWIVSTLCFFTFILFATSNNKESEGFWKKRRNILVAGIISAACFGVAPYVLSEAYFVPMICSFLIAHVSHLKFVDLFSNNQKDLEALQSKLLKNDAERRNFPILENSLPDSDYQEPIETTA